ncbi:unnamed protein product [Absidia cylindrospora]
MALLSKVALKLKKLSKATVNRQASTKNNKQSPLGVNTKPTIAKKSLPRPPNSMNKSTAAPATSDQQYTNPPREQQYTNPPPEQQQRNVPQPPPPSTNQPSGYFPVLLSPVPVRKLPPYDHNLVERRVECSEQADDLYRQLEHRLDTRHQGARILHLGEQQDQINHQATFASAVPAGPAAWLSSAIAPAAPAANAGLAIPPAGPAAWPFSAIAPAAPAANAGPAIPPAGPAIPPAGPAIPPSAPAARRSTAIPPASPAAKPSDITARQLTFAVNPPLSPAAKHPTTNAQPPAGPATSKGHSMDPSTSPHHPAPPTTHFFQNQLPPMRPQSWPQKPGYMSDQQYSNYPYQHNNNNAYTAADSYQAHGSNSAYYEHSFQLADNGWSARNQLYSRPNHQNHPAAAGHLGNQKWVHKTHVSYSTPHNTSPPAPPFMGWQTPQQYSNPTGASAATSANTKNKRPIAAPSANKQPSVTPARPQANRLSNTPPPHSSPQPSPENIATSAAAKTLKKQNYQSPLVTFGIHPEQSTKTTRGNKRVDKPLCVFEAEGGTCNDDTCHSMHFRDF